MVVLLTGATGFIGGHVLRALLDAGHDVRAVARRPGPAIPGVVWAVGDFSRQHAPEDWAAVVAGVDAVVNAVGIIREVPGQTFEALHTRAPVALFRAARAAGVRRLVQVSALGCDDRAPEPYFRTKRVADRVVEELGGVVLRPSFVWGPGDLSMRFFRQLAALPVVPVVGDGAYRVQPVHVGDVARAVVRAVEGEARGAFDVGGDDALSFDELLDALRLRMGRSAAPKLHVPLPLIRLVAAATDAVGRGPITRDELGMLLRGSTCDLAPFAATFGFRPRGFRAALALEAGADREATLAEMDAIVPFLRFSVGFIWLATPVATWLLWPREENLALLRAAGIPESLAPLAIDATCVLEVVLGLLTWAGWRLGLVGGMQLLLVGTFTVLLAVTGSPLWGHPFGPLTKNIPLLGAILALVATRERR